MVKFNDLKFGDVLFYFDDSYNGYSKKVVFISGSPLENEIYYFSYIEKNGVEVIPVNRNREFMFFDSMEDFLNSRKEKYLNDVNSSLECEKRYYLKIMGIKNE